MKNKIENIHFNVEEFHVEFRFLLRGVKATAYLQLPDCPDSKHSLEVADKSKKLKPKVFNALKDFFYESFSCRQTAAMCAAAGIDNECDIVSIEDIVQDGTYVDVILMRDEYDEDDFEYIVLSEMSCSDYYNVYMYEVITEERANEFGVDLYECKKLAVEQAARSN